ncbi:MAG TPA: hypothetical protein VMU75_15615 [Acidimicrobiales bacterium]|nr:hypothetical protein [Acidimicrobiales bacterium]
MTVRLTLAISDYDHTRDLTDGRVRPEGVELTCLSLPVEEIFFRFINYREWHASELSFAKYVSMRASGDDSITAIPVFPSRVCRHSSIYVTRGGPAHPKELAGKRIGVPEWSQTASVYTRSLLVHEWGVPLTDVEWFQAGVNQAGRTEKVRLHLPDGVRLTQVTDRTLDEMLHAGDLDAVFSAHPPRSFELGDPGIVRLFPDYRPIEEEYVRRTGIFPIMHVLALRSDVLDEHPWIAMNLLSAFEEAKRRSEERLSDITASRVPLPWLPEYASGLRGLLGGSVWPYGLEPNRTTIEAFLRFAAEQGVAARLLQAESLFAPQVLTRYRV